MDRLHIFIYVLLGVVSFSHGWTSGSELEMTVRPGENISLYCDCKLSTGVYIVWYRNCSHENQPSLVLKNVWTLTNIERALNPLPRFHFVRNFSSESYDLLIINTTETDEGLYYCGTETFYVESEKQIIRRHLYTNGNVSTRIRLNSSEPDHNETSQNCGDCNGVCWMLLFSLCPAVAALSSLLSSLLVYHLCKKEAKEPQTDLQTPQTRQNQDQDVCFAALEIRPVSHRPKRTTTQSSVTYSAIDTSRM
ncbi:uncharacterized protein LOC117481624 isoform X1 [Trematomus bernacchii]|uniref:uncharacterized protein LOC117481624 isoform X1 n=1 Tax=Trematomus bernacchii TaxID=40690 RepID=UPI00146F0DAD|nr:uncharacterized protein LOC117481624 isoform X1 [Trematomus bernacchii]